MPSSESGRSFIARAIQTLLTGFIGILPVALTVVVLVWVVDFLHDLVGPDSRFGAALKSIGMSVLTCEVTAYVVGVLGTLGMVYGLGLLIERGSGINAWQTIESALRRIPLLGTVYDAAKQLTSVFDRKAAAQQNMAPVICYFGEDRNAGVPALMPTPELVHIGDQAYHLVIIPTAPVPFGGALVCVKAEWVQQAPCGFEDLVGVFMSMGVTGPRCLSEKRQDQPMVQQPQDGVS